MTKFKKTYRVESTRLPEWDYGQNGSYFITVCTHNHVSRFGDIQDGHICLSHVGIIADILWHEIKNHARNIHLSEFVVMPNHVHGILILDDGDDNGNAGIIRDAGIVETRHALSLQNNDNSPNPRIDTPNNATPPRPTGRNRFQNQGKNTISSIVGSYKSAVTRHARRLGFDFRWQTNFWEHIIRNDDEFARIVEYIVSNPAKWDQDKLNNDTGNNVLEPTAPYNEEIWMV